MSKKKIQRFAEIKTFSNVFEPRLEELKTGNHPLKGKWNSTYFKNNNPIVLELGCGKGEYSIGMAEKYPGKNFIGVDIKGARIWNGAKKATMGKINNVAFLRTRIEFIDSFFANGEVAEIWITFPDPQPQKPREKKRLTSLKFLKIYQNFLSAKGMIYLKTDNAGLLEYSLEVIEENHFELIFCSRDIYGDTEYSIPKEATSIQTYYEFGFLKQGLKICFLIFSLNRKKRFKT